MNQNLFARFAPVIASLTVGDLADMTTLRRKLALEQEDSMEVCYLPFEHRNPDARLIILGLSPGPDQMRVTLPVVQQHLRAHSNVAATLRAAKLAGAFGGAMRSNLVRMLDSVGMQKWLGLNSCDALFGEAFHKVAMTSVIRYPTFMQDGTPYNGQIAIGRSKLLNRYVMKYLAEELAEMPEARILPLGTKVPVALNMLVKAGLLDSSRVLEPMPHPSRASQERVKCFLEEYAPDHAYSIRTRPERISASRRTLRGQITELPSDTRQGQRAQMAAAN